MIGSLLNMETAKATFSSLWILEVVSSPNETYTNRYAQKIKK